MNDFILVPEDLAPGDQSSATFDSSAIEVHRIASLEDPLFEEAYGALWKYFGPSNEMESVEVLGRRFESNQLVPASLPAMWYEMVLFRSGGCAAAVCDHTAVVDARGVVVHVSHILIEPARRRTGLGGWVRAIPIQTARRCLVRAGLSSELPITLVAEVEYPEGDSERIARLKSFERAGFSKIDPALIDYRQPDFRAPDVIDSTGGPRPLPFQLLLRQSVGNLDGHVSGSEVRRLVDCLYRVYSRDFRAEDMAVVWERLDAYPAAEDLIRLVRPTG